MVRRLLVTLLAVSLAAAVVVIGPPATAVGNPPYSTPVTIGPEATLAQALELMEQRRSQISVLPVVDAAGRALGLIRIHDIYLGNTVYLGNRPPGEIT